MITLKMQKQLSKSVIEDIKAITYERDNLQIYADRIEITFTDKTAEKKADKRLFDNQKRYGYELI